MNLACLSKNLFAGILLTTISLSAGARQTYNIDYLFDFTQQPGKVAVTIQVAAPELLTSIDFNLKHSQCRNFEGDNVESDTRKQRVLWLPSGKQSQLHYQCEIKHARASRQGKAYDAWWQQDFAIFRGDDLVPPARVRALKGASARARVAFKLPKAWPHVNTGWQLAEPERTLVGYNTTFEVVNPERKFDRPTGWMIVGDLGTRREQLGSKQQTQVAVSAPKDTNMSRMDALAFITLLWPEIETAFVDLPPKVLVVSGDDPMWRGGLSAGNSLFLHAQRPMISENATSTLIHELVHVITRLSASQKDDWIVEGIAEFYASALLRRAGGLTETRYQKVIANQQSRAGNNTDFRKASSKFVQKAAAANFFYELDNTLRKQTQQKASLDQVVQQLMKKRKVNFEDLKQAVAKVSPDASAMFKRFAP